MFESRRFVLAFAVALVPLAGCSSTAPSTRTPAAPTDAARRVVQIADEYYAGFLAAQPISATFGGLPEAPTDRLDDNSLAALARWEGQEDGWLARVREVPEAELAGTRDAVTLGILRETLEGAVARRVCRRELWDVSQMFGAQQLPTLLTTVQPVGSEDKRAHALARYRQFGRFFDTEITNLREGLRRGYAAPRRNVDAVVEQLDGLLKVPLAESPVLRMAEQDGTPAFRPALLEVLRAEVYPGLERYRRFLKDEYAPRARATAAVADLPDGAACYRALVRAHTTLDIEPARVHELGKEEMARVQTEMRALATRAFGTTDLAALFTRLRSDPKLKFGSREAVVKAAEAAVARAETGLPRFFGIVPRAKMIVDPCLPFEEKSGCPNSYTPAAQDGSRPARWRVNANPEHGSRLQLEVIAFHEGYPGHHLQIAIMQELPGVHPIVRAFINSGYAEGWGLYSERVANEMGVYSDDVAQLGRLSSSAFRAARLVVDPGLHVLGWTRQQAIDYMLANVAIPAQVAASEVDRYVIMPGQATAYMIGRLEIERLRSEAERRLGPKFDVRAFHDRILENGSVPLGFLRRHIERWLDSPSPSQ